MSEDSYAERFEFYGLTRAEVLEEIDRVLAHVPEQYRGAATIDFGLGFEWGESHSYIEVKWARDQMTRNP